MLKRNMGSALRARNYHSQNREIRLRVLTHNLAILWRQVHVLYRADRSPYIPVPEIHQGHTGPMPEREMYVVP